MADFVEICNVCARKAIIEAAKRMINSDKVCHSYSDFNFGVTFLEHSVDRSLQFFSSFLTSPAGNVQYPLTLEWMVGY